MNKKGFTLVELLAVIAILAILVIIALPNVMGMFNTAKENSFKTEVKEIYKVAQQTWMQDSMFKTDEKVYSRCNSGCSNGLDLSGRSDLQYYIKLNKSGKVVEYYVTDGTFQYIFNDPDGLNVEDIKNVQKVADLNEDEIITINGNGGGGSSGTYTGTIYIDALSNQNFVSIGDSIEQKKKIKSTPKWCEIFVGNDIEYSSCISDNPRLIRWYETEYDCKHSTWCYVDASGNDEKCSMEKNTSYDTQNRCQTDLNNDVSNGVYPSGKYTCALSYFGSCEQRNFDLGDYSTTSSSLKTDIYTKHDVVNNIITSSYGCFTTNHEVCLKYGLDNIESNKNILLEEQSWFNSNSGLCTFNSNNAGCSLPSNRLRVGVDEYDISITRFIIYNDSSENYSVCVSNNGEVGCPE